MQLGYSTMNNLHLHRPDDLARALEERGFDSLWIGEHAHIPAHGRTPYPAGGELPETYKHMADPFVSLTLAGAATKKLKLALGVSLILERDVFSTAKAVATLDVLSGGRVIVGIGVGWNEDEFENTAKMPWAKRYSGLAECVRALRALWTEDEASCAGEWYKFDRVWCYPKPLQKPTPPVYVGVAGRTGTAHAVQWGDAWFPIDIGAKDIGPKLERFRVALREAGRDPATVPVTVLAFGEPDLARLQRYAELGIERVVVHGAGDESKPLPYLDKFAAMITKLK